MKQDSKPETEIPAEIVEIAQQMGDDYSKNYEAEFSPRSANSGRECALAMYRKLQADKPTGLRWVKVSDASPKTSGNYFVKRHFSSVKAVHFWYGEEYPNDRGWSSACDEWLDEGNLNPKR